MAEASTGGGPRRKQPSLTSAGWGLLGLVFLIAVVPRGDPEPAASAGGAKREVSPAGDVTVPLSVGEQTDLMRVIKAGEKVAGAAKGLAQGGDNSRIRTARFVVRLEGQDRYGNKELWPFLTLTYAMAELRKVNYDNIESWAMLDLAGEVTAEGGYTHRAVAAYCAGMASPRFCAKAR